MRILPRSAVLACLVAGALMLAACGSQAPEKAAPAGQSASAGASGKVSANTASEDELVQAFAAADIPNAAKWAEEVMEYRPYATDDLNFGKLREELAKYNPAPGVVDKIVAALEP